jgi:hypothetical protein
MVRRIECMLGKKVHRQKRFSERERVVSRAIVVVSEETLLLERTKWSIRGQNVDGQKKRVIFAWRELTECCTGMQYEFSRYPFYFIGGVGCWPWGTMARREEKSVFGRDEGQNESGKPRHGIYLMYWNMRVVTG